MAKTDRIEQAFDRYRREAVPVELPSFDLPGDHGVLPCGFAGWKDHPSPPPAELRALT